MFAESMLTADELATAADEYIQSYLLTVQVQEVPSSAPLK